MDPAATCPLTPPRWGQITDNRVGLGDLVEIVAKPFAHAFRMKCLDEKQNLRADSPCAKKKAKLNRVRLWRRTDE